MNNKGSFEDIIKTKIEGLEKQPSAKVKRQLSKRIQSSKLVKKPYLNIALVAAASLLFIVIIYTAFPSLRSPKNQAFKEKNHTHSDEAHPNSHHGHKTIKGHEPKKKMVAMSPQDIKTQSYINALQKAKIEHKLILLYGYNNDCSHCSKMQEEVFENLEVQQFLEEHFIKIDIDLKDIEKNIEVIRFYNINIVPKFIFLDAEGHIIMDMNGATETGDFIQHLEIALEKESGEEYQKLATSKTVNKANLTKNLSTTIFPNPSKGLFKVAIKGANESITISIIDLNGKLVEVKTIINNEESPMVDFDLTGKSGQYIVQIRQGKEMISKKVIIL